MVHILQQVAGALAEAHGIGLIHRDVKPANIILCERGGLPDVAKVVDFGLVKRIDVDRTDSTVAVTAKNTVMGTPLYMAPEALKADGTVDARSDLYALGAVGYFLLTGTPVFRGSTLLEVLAHHLSTPPEPPSARLGMPIAPDLERLILQCLAKSPEDRPHDSKALQLALSRLSVDGTWTTADAAAWWERYRHRHVPEAGQPGASEPTGTVSADLEERWRSGSR